MDGARRVHRAAELPEQPAPEVFAALLEPPAGLSGDVQACWRELAPKAIASLTLTDNQVPGFRELCLRQARVRSLDETIDRLGAGTKEAQPYLAMRCKAAVLLSASLKDFKLSAFGKPVISDKPKPAANPWAAMSRQAK